MPQKVIVIGGGPAGMISAGRAAELGADVILLEKMNKLGLKLSLTGKGKCNITNTEPEISTFVEHYGKNGKFLTNAFHRFFNKDLIGFFENLGLELKQESGGRIYPKSDDSWLVVDALKKYINKNNVQIKLEYPVKELLHYKNKIGGVISNKENFLCDAVIVATGGASYPQTGSEGDGYRFAHQTGHRVCPIYPALVPLNIRFPIIPEQIGEGTTQNLSGLKLKNVLLIAYKNDEKLAEEFGEFYFTDFGIDGSAALKLSSKIKEAILSSELKMKIDLKPALTQSQLHSRIIREIENNGKMSFKTLLKSFLPRQMITIFQELCNIDTHKRIAEISKTERERIVNLLKGFELAITGTRPLSEAIITSGGVDLSQINPQTMESRIISGLYFAGEVLDIDGDTGGYNLQAAFSTGYLAGESVAIRNN
ncbi:MAG: NAD(P)/FAD-dependent oxidoreductase [Candidatus Cloacimonetes bacterium]|nr:NAD(P)/FAD-dependent oxidoreductase [Candidatus Cloacimonadota bacterium]